MDWRLAWTYTLFRERVSNRKRALRVTVFQCQRTDAQHKGRPVPKGKRGGALHKRRPCTPSRTSPLESTDLSAGRLRHAKVCRALCLAEQNAQRESGQMRSMLSRTAVVQR